MPIIDWEPFHPVVKSSGTSLNSIPRFHAERCSNYSHSKSKMNRVVFKMHLTLHSYFVKISLNHTMYGYYIYCIHVLFKTHVIQFPNFVIRLYIKMFEIHVNYI